MTSHLSVQSEPPDTPDARSLIGALDIYLNRLYPPENRYGLPLAALRDPSVTFLVARWDGAAIGCVAVKFFPASPGDGAYAEVKRMYVDPRWRGRGIAQALLTELEALTRQHGLSVLRLETGVHQHEAASLYQRMGFSRCIPFGSYADDGVSLCCEKMLREAEVPGPD